MMSSLGPRPSALGPSPSSPGPGPQAPAPPSLVVLISGTGRNLQALIDATADGRLPARIGAVISNRADAPGLARAERAGIPTQVLRPRDYPDRDSFDRAVADAVAAREPDAVALAGYMRILNSAFVQRFAGKLVNIHPSLLPKYRGMDTHRRVLEAGDAWHGATVHFVTDDLDAGPGLLQGSIAVAKDDTPESLAERLMQKVETRIYPEAAAWLATGRATLENGRACLDGEILEAPIHVDCDT